jgi:putative addiction module killer protein
MYTVLQSDEFNRWLTKLRDGIGRSAVVARLRKATLGNLGDWKAVGEGVFEMRVDVGPGYRLYFARRGDVIILMLGGGDKSTQKADIRRAQQLVAELEES